MSGALIVVCSSPLLPPCREALSPLSPLNGGPADSLLGSLCREMGKLLSRRRQIATQLPRCRDAGLIRRLQGELQRMAVRQAEVHAVGLALRRAPGLDPFSVAFLVELSGRHGLA